VDDIIINGDDTQNIKKLKQDMMGTFKMTDLGPAHYYLGIELQQCPEGIYFHQRCYISNLQDRFGMMDCTLLNIPMNPRTKLQKDTKTALVDPKLYQILVGGLLHATISR
jgi:hypothetical protein